MGYAFLQNEPLCSNGVCKLRDTIIHVCPKRRNGFWIYSLPCASDLVGERLWQKPVASKHTHYQYIQSGNLHLYSILTRMTMTPVSTSFWALAVPGAAMRSRISILTPTRCLPCPGRTPGSVHRRRMPCRRSRTIHHRSQGECAFFPQCLSGRHTRRRSPFDPPQQHLRFFLNLAKWTSRLSPEIFHPGDAKLCRWPWVFGAFANHSISSAHPSGFKNRFCGTSRPLPC